VRLRVDGSKARLENHPGNTQAPGAVQRVFPAGPYSALVAADNGLFVAESGWLIEPSWRDALDPTGIVAAAMGGDGVVWLAHERGLFRIEAGELSELKVERKSLRGLTALAVAPAPNGANAVWIAQGKALSYARQTARARYEVVAEGLPEETAEAGITGLAGVSASPESAGELWLITASGLFHLAQQRWVSQQTPGAPQALVSAGRYVWLQTTEGLFRYDADADRWGEIEGIDAPLSLLAADASGSVWVKSAEQSLALSQGSIPRVFGIFEGARVYDADVHVRAQIFGTDPPERVSFLLDDGEQVERGADDALPGEGTLATLGFALGGFDAAGREQSYSLAGIGAGMHTLTVRAHFASGMAQRKLHFDFRSGSARPLSFARDVQPIFDARCAKCHTSGPGHALGGYDQWVAEKERIVRAVVELRMPADGPLDPNQIQTLQRWAAGGAEP
jgi:mono/diheme cytochrome c family protein